MSDPEVVLFLDPEDLSEPGKSSSMKSRSRLWKCSHARCDARCYSRKALVCRAILRPFYVLVFIIGLFNLFSFTWGSLLSFLADARDTRLFPDYRPSLFSQWLTHGVSPVACHSHNDYWRHVPLFSALAAGCISVEADVWLHGDELRVGHTPHTVLPGQTLRSLYLDPLLEMLHKYNTAVNGSTVATDLMGVFATDPMQTLVLLVDFKADGELIWPYLMEQLEPLRENGYLTYFNGSEVINRPITVVASGDAPLDRILMNAAHRDVFYDAPLDVLAHSAFSTVKDIKMDGSIFNDHNSYYASVDFHKSIGSLPLSRLSQGQLAKIQNQVRAAHERGLKVRYWGTPKWPVGLRNYVWRALVREGVDVLNVDDLHGATKVDWSQRSW
ncbi:altered inheritance of mitochondria protein 6 [Penicillium cinerascens]|uniref:Altered inheritance of mitochondria protein 6 n=1 Tax=Penicillium cinerascens TaxID=70096 RepID=A0A9W9JP17_9EURO|nr:altered inheritance of mitochondria protein 6 [Penicillium cinerascens]KAJ5198450.1 altered inheritance of mitochondria protein 6 [Penicillium cinerascens]